MKDTLARAPRPIRRLARRLGVDLLAPTLERQAMRGISALPRGLLHVLAGRPTHVDGQRLDPTTQLGLRLDRLSRRPAFEALDPVTARATFARLCATLAPPRAIPLPVVSERTIPGPLRVRRYQPDRRSARPEPTLIFFHGGGHVVGDLDTHDPLCRLLAKRARVQVVAVDYRRAPEARFPAAFDDALASFRWLRDAGPAEGFDPTRIAVGGDSAGSNLAAAVALATARLGEPGPAFQLLFYPLLDATHADPAAPIRPPSYTLFGQGYGLDATTIAWFRHHYLGPDGDPTDPRISPARADDLSALAPAWIGTAGFDPLRDEATRFAARLTAAGVPVEHRVFADLTHGFASFFGVVPAARDAVEAAADALAAALR